MQKRRHLIFILLIIGFISYTAFVFMDAVTPYVTIREAKKSLHTVQVKGLLDENAPSPYTTNGEFIFQLKDEEGDTLLVRYLGEKPPQFDSAFHIVAVGKYGEDAFLAKKLLIKCPSKYEKERS